MAREGLGRAIAERLAKRGLTVLVTDIDGALAEQAAREIGHGATAAALDVRDPAALRSAAAEATERGRLAVWVNNAGVVRAEPVTEHADEDVDLLVATNLLGVVNGSRAAIERMRADGGGRILNVASLSALTRPPAWRYTAPPSTASWPSPWRSRRSFATRGCRWRSEASVPTASARTWSSATRRPRGPRP